MAINQASCFFYAPGYVPCVEPGTGGQGTPMVIDACATEETARKVEAGAFTNWLTEQGFVETERSDQRLQLVRNLQETFLGEIGEIEASVGLDGPHVELAYMRFLITRELLERLADWQLLAISMGETFGFRLMNEANTLGSCRDLSAQIREHPNVLELGRGWGFLDKLEQN